MKVAYRSNARPAHSTENDVAAALRSLGHEVAMLQEDTTTWAQHRKFCERYRPDLFCWTRTWTPEPYAQGHRFLDWCRTVGIPSVSYHLDLYVGLDREQQILDGDPFWRTDYVFTADGSHDAWFAEQGINHRWMPPAVNAESCYRAQPDARLYRQPIVFVGSWQGYHGEHAWRQTLVQGLRRHYGPRLFGLYPRGRAVRQHQLNVLYATARVVVGDTLRLPGCHHYWSDRLYETLGRGGFMLFPYVEGIDEHVTDGEHVILYEPDDGLDALTDRIDYWLHRPHAERDEIQQAAYEHVLANHTYRHRVEALLDALGLADEAVA